jgi:GLPGLI family protein
MKKLLILLLLTCFNTYSQNEDKLIVYYKIKTTVNAKGLNKTATSNPKQMQYFLKMKENMESVEYLLKINNKISEFEVVKKMSLNNNNNPFQILEERTRIYIDTSTFIEQKTAFNQLYLIEETFNPFNWKLLNESKTILGYNCYRATTNNGLDNTTIEAWYAPELPYQFGPKGYHGLPGLILEIIQNKKLHFTATEINWSDDVFVIKPTTGKKIKREALNNMYDSAIKEMKSYNKN